MRPTDLFHSERCGHLLEEWRHKNGLTRYQFGRMSGLRQETIAKVEQGKGSMESFVIYLYYIAKCDNLRDWHTLRNLLFD